ncbi:MAG: TolC family protein [Bryobacterales bacterium]|nr:TolC family protein [Bryobacterales bacterium]
MRCVLYMAAGLLSVLPAVSMAQTPVPKLTLEDCLRLARSVPSPVSVARQELEIAARGLSQARAAFLPQSRMANGFTYNSPLPHDRANVSFLPLNGIREYSLLLNVNQEFDLSGRLRAELSRARIAQEATSTEMALSERDLRRAVTGAYYRALLTGQLARIAGEALSESRSFEGRTRLLFSGGEAAQADVVKAAAQTASLEQAVNAAALAAELAKQELASFWTQDVAAPFELADVLGETPPPPEPESADTAPYLRRLEFRLLDAQKRGFEADVRRERSALLPQLGLVFQYGVDSSAIRIRDRGYAAFVNLTIPLFDWNSARNSMAQSRLRIHQAEDARTMAERSLSKEYRAALSGVKHLFQQIALTRRQAELAEEDLRLSRIRYEGGEGLALDVVTAQNQLAQARSNYYTATAEYLMARADLEVAAGR